MTTSRRTVCRCDHRRDAHMPGKGRCRAWFNTRNRDADGDELMRRCPCPYFVASARGWWERLWNGTEGLGPMDSSGVIGDREEGPWKPV